MTIHTSIERAPRHDGWTPERKTRFLDCLAEKGNVRHACSRVGLSQQAAYVLRRRDAEFARGWAAALAQAREGCAQVLAERAIDGVEEPIWYRGEQVGTRRKYDTRLLLAHLARLDKLVEAQAESPDDGRFDELLACIAGEPVPPILASDDDLLPLDRESAAQRAGDEADFAVRYAAPAEVLGRSPEDEDFEDRNDEADWYDADDDEEESEIDEAAFDAFEGACIEAFRLGRGQAQAQWDGWFEDACDFVDGAAGRLDEPPAPGLPGGAPLAGGEEALSADLLAKLARVAAEMTGAQKAGVSPSWTHSKYSTSALARALAGPAKGFDFTPRSPFAREARR
jgi:hypothetical protein